MNNQWATEPQPVTAAADDSAVNLTDEYEVRRWCQRLICTEAQLRAAVGTVGTDPGQVRAYLHDRR